VDASRGTLYPIPLPRCTMHSPTCGLAKLATVVSSVSGDFCRQFSSTQRGVRSALFHRTTTTTRLLFGERDFSPRSLILAVLSLD